jgi:hypothetical protein
MDENKYMRLGSFSVWVASLFVLAVSVVQAVPPIDPCTLPRGLHDKISSDFPSARLVRMADLSDQGRGLFQKDHGRVCPGVVKVNFYGDERPTWALVLISGENPKRKAELIVGHQVGDVWEIRSLETTDGTPAVWREEPGRYNDLDGQKTIRATRPVIVFAGYGSWAVLYAWDGKEVQKIQISD